MRRQKGAKGSQHFEKEGCLCREEPRRLGVAEWAKMGSEECRSVVTCNPSGRAGKNGAFRCDGKGGGRRDGMTASEEKATLLSEIGGLETWQSEEKEGGGGMKKFKAIYMYF